MALARVIQGLVFAAGWAWAQPPQVEIQAPFVRTPSEAVTAMLKLAGVGAGDVLYDLGSGDGRIVIAAAKQARARAVGIEISPERVAEARRRAAREGIAETAVFRVGDIFDADLGEATVVTLFLLADLNLKLKPRLLKQLRPGSRVVSYCFDMGDWKPDKVVDVAGCRIYLWTIAQR